MARRKRGVELAWIAEALRPLAVPIDSVQPHPDNPREHDEANIAAIATELERSGQVDVLVVQASTGYVLSGNGRWAAAKRLGWTHVAVNRQELDDERAKLLMIAMNRLGELSTWDEAAVASLVAELFESETLDRPGIDNLDLGEFLPQDDDSSDDLNQIPAPIAERYQVIITFGTLKEAESHYREAHARNLKCRVVTI